MEEDLRSHEELAAQAAGRTDTPEPAADPVDTVDERAFHQLLVNTLVSGVTSSFLWFALTFWVYLETRSVIATGVIGGMFGLAGAVIAPAYGTYVDHHRKHASLMLATGISAVAFTAAALLYVLFDHEDLLSLRQPWFWLLVALTLAGSVAGSIRSVALSTCVTMLVPVDRRDRANGMVGTITGLAFAVTSVFSGIVIGTLGMGWAFAIALVLTVVAVVHLSLIRFAEPEPDPAGEGTPHVDVRGAIDAIHAVPGLWLLIVIAAFNNLLGGVLMALMDPYGLELMSVQSWGVLWMGLSLVMILGGLAVARYGLGPSPLRVIIVGNLASWIACAFFTIQESIPLLVLGMVVWMALEPAIEAAEQTVLQRVIPFERQGRVFGFSQLVENLASPLTAFMAAPLAQAFVMPFMEDGNAGADAIGGWFGTGPERGIALLFTAAGLIGITLTLGAWGSRSYRRLASEEHGELLAAET